jgi:iron complex transport system substrate-binding protein
MRVVTCTCSNTEIVAALGRSDWLVGIDDHSDYPQNVVAHLPRVGPDLGIDVDRVAALAPDLVLASLTVPGHEEVVDRLTRGGLPVVATEPISVADVYADIRLIGSLIDAVDRAEQVVAEMRSELERPVTHESRPRVLVEWWPKPVIVPGRDSWVNQLLDAVGGSNPLAHRDVKSTPITDEEARALNPDAVVIAWCGVPFRKYRPDVVYRRVAWQSLPALQNRHVFPVPEAYLGRPGPRLVDGSRALRNVVEACLQSKVRPSTSSI